MGFRGIWLFPNLFDDNQTFAGSFMPVFGKGDPVVAEEDSDEEYWEHHRKKKKNSEGKDGETKSEDEKKKPKVRHAAPKFRSPHSSTPCLLSLPATYPERGIR